MIWIIPQDSIKCSKNKQYFAIMMFRDSLESVCLTVRVLLLLKFYCYFSTLFLKKTTPESNNQQNKNYPSENRKEKTFNLLIVRSCRSLRVSQYLTLKVPSLCYIMYFLMFYFLFLMYIMYFLQSKLI